MRPIQEPEQNVAVEDEEVEAPPLQDLQDELEQEERDEEEEKARAEAIERLNSWLTRFTEGDLTFEQYQRLSAEGKAQFRSIHKGKARRNGFIKGRPMSQAEIDAYDKDRNKARKARRLASKKRKVNYRNGSQTGG